MYNDQMFLSSDYSLFFLSNILQLLQGFFCKEEKDFDNWCSFVQKASIRKGIKLENYYHFLFCVEQFTIRRIANNQRDRKIERERCPQL